MKLDSATLNKIISNHIRGVVAHYSRYHAVSGVTLQNTLDQIQNVINNTKSALKLGLHEDWMKGSLEQAIKDMDLDINGDQRKELAFKLAQAHVQGLKKAQDAVSGEDPALSDEPSGESSPDPGETKPESGTSSIALSSLIDQYRQHQISTGTWRPGCKRKAQCLAVLILCQTHKSTA